MFLIQNSGKVITARSILEDDQKPTPEVTFTDMDSNYIFEVWAGFHREHTFMKAVGTSLGDRTTLNCHLYKVSTWKDWRPQDHQEISQTSKFKVLSAKTSVLRT